MLFDRWRQIWQAHTLPIRIFPLHQFLLRRGISQFVQPFAPVVQSKINSARRYCHKIYKSVIFCFRNTEIWIAPHISPECFFDNIGNIVVVLFASMFIVLTTTLGRADEHSITKQYPIQILQWRRTDAGRERIDNIGITLDTLRFSLLLAPNWRFVAAHERHRWHILRHRRIIRGIQFAFLGNSEDTRCVPLHAGHDERLFDAALGYILKKSIAEICKISYIILIENDTFTLKILTFLCSIFLVTVSTHEL